MLPSVRPMPTARQEWRKQYRTGSALLIAILVVISGLPLIILVLMPSCTDLSIRGEALVLRERVAFNVQPQVRVALAVRTHGGVALPIKVTGGYRLVDPQTQRTLVRGARLSRSPVQALAQGIVITVPDAHGITRTMHLPVLRIVPTKVGTLHVGGRRYRGVLDLVYETDGRMTVVNELPIEDYVGGVVAPEMFFYWPREALRAQAVVARTYTLARVMEARQTRPAPAYDLICSYIADQEYEGISGEKPTTVEAVSSTEGLVLTHKGKLFRAYYSSCCGGHTEACGVAWDDYPTIPPLAGKPCGFCKHSKWYNWTRRITLSDIESSLKRAGKDVGSVQDIRFVDTNNEGHVDRVTVIGSRRTLTMNGNDFRLAAGSLKLLSMNFKSRRLDGEYEFTGHGWGHGSGMCQYGAMGMASLLKTHKDILAFYYPEAELWKMY